MGFEDLMVIDRRDRERTEEQIREGSRREENGVGGEEHFPVD